VTGGGSLQVHLIGWFTSLNETFGPVLRVDFHDGNPHFPFRAVVWRKLDGELTAMVATLDDSTPVAA
jgi:hypothetical protein